MLAIPEAKLGSARIEHFEVEDNFLAWRAGVPPGKYTRLLAGGVLWMSDTPMEKRWNCRIMYQSSGRVLIAGLGLGVILPKVLERAQHVTVIEKNPDVIALVEPHYRCKKLTVINADIHEWTPPKGSKWDVIYFDIWGDVSTDVLPEMAKLHRRFARFRDTSNSEGWIDSWGCSELRSELRREKASRWW